MCANECVCERERECVCEGGCVCVGGGGGGASACVHMSACGPHLQPEPAELSCVVLIH